MEYCGMYMISAENKKLAKYKTYIFLETIIKPLLLNEYKGPIDFKLTDTLDGFDVGEYDSYFIFNAPNINFKEDTAMFYALEGILCTGLSVLDEEL